MIKKEVIAKIETKIADIESYLSWEPVEKSKAINQLNFAIDLIKQMDEPKLPVIPQFVADRIKEYKEIQFGISLIYMINRQLDDDVKFSKWLSSEKDNCELVARAFLDNYTIEKEPEWIVFYSQYRNKCFKDFNGINGFKYGSFKEAIKFTSKEKAEAVALLTGGEIEEVEEFS